MVAIDRLQSYLRESARQRYEDVAVPPFTIFFHPASNLIHWSYAIPDRSTGGNLGVPLTALRLAFAARDRLARFEFIEEFALDLAPSLRGAGFIEEARVPLMVCTPETLRPAPEVPGLTLLLLDGNSSDSDARDYLATGFRIFELNESLPEPGSEVERVLRDVEGGQAFLARFGGRPVGVGAFVCPYDGLVEVGGIGTLEPDRRRGIASSATSRIVREAFDRGVDVAMLSAGDERASRLYERLGFRRLGTMLTYSDPAPADRGR